MTNTGTNNLIQLREEPRILRMVRVRLLMLDER